jgi:hypothetical protein
MNPLQITGPLPPYHQPGTPAAGPAGSSFVNPLTGYDPGRTNFICPFDGSVARQVGSTRFPWLCLQGHQFDFNAADGSFRLGPDQFSAPPCLVRPEYPWPIPPDNNGSAS